MNKNPINLPSVLEEAIEARDAIHLWFSLSYAQYLTVPRSVLQSMPQEWQVKFVALLKQLDNTIDWRPEYPTQYRVGLFNVVDKEPGDEYDTWERDWGDEINDPYMDYERGRRKVAYRNE